MDTEIMTLDQIARLMTDDADRLERAQTSLSDARRSHDAILSRYGGDQGAAAPAVREEQDAILAAVERDVAGVAEVVRRNGQEIMRQLERAGGSVLNPEDTQRAAALREELKEDIARLDPVALRDRMVAALTLNDRASMHHLVRYVPLRDFGPGTGAAGEPQALAEIPRLLSRMQDALRNHALDPHRERARTVLGKAVDLHTTATQRRSQREAEEAVLRMHGGRPGVPIPTDDQLAGVVR